MMHVTSSGGMSTHAKMGLLGSLYFSQGLPFGFFTQSLPVLLRKQGFSLGETGLVSLLAIPWALKFLWAPAVDRYSIARIGRRKSWIVPLQLASAAILAALASYRNPSSMAVLMGAVLLLNLVAATQDIATDGLAVDLLAPAERGLANGLRLGSAITFLSMAGLTALATVPILVAREPRGAGQDEHRPSATIHFLRRPGAARLLVLLVAYKAGDAFATGMLRPFLADAGLSLADLGWLLGTVGFVAGLLGALSGGALVNRLGRRSALVLFGMLQAAAIAGYAYLAMGKPGHAALYSLAAAEHFAGGMATAALFTCMMDGCSREASATDYTVQASVVVIATGAASAVAGYSAQILGYFGHFCLATVLALGALVAVRRCFPTPEAAEVLRSEAKEVALCA